MRIRRAKRRRENKTDYKARFNLLKSNLPRLVVRKTNKYIIAHIVESKEAQDKTVAYFNSKGLKKYSWPITFKNLAAAYLTGFVLGKKYKKTGKVILDLGLQRSTKGSRIYAVVKGIKDAGVGILCEEKILPTDQRVYMEYKNKKIKEIIETIKKELGKNG
ncbi:MAG: 50S ribosomal protein L18 [archaeon]|nr:MAG: 50S ribosomal protein L18 [archaeon]